MKEMQTKSYLKYSMMKADRGMERMLWEHRERNCARRGWNGREGFIEEVGLI